MPFQPYFPEPISVPGNVALAKHRIRTTYVRKVAGLHIGLLAIAGLIGWKVQPPLNLWSSILLFVICLVGLTLIRRAFNGSKIETVLDGVMLVPTIGALGFVLGDLIEVGWPVAVMAPSILALGLYVLLCGNDLSYTGQFALCLIFTVAAAIGGVALGWWPSEFAASGVLYATVYMLYFVYDLSMLVKRRRVDELFPAVADLFRDLLNFVTYSGRVYLHWRRFRLF